MQFKATLDSRSHIHKKWKAKGITPYTILGVPFKWIPEIKSYQTDILTTDQVSKLMNNEDVLLGVITNGIPIDPIISSEISPEPEQNKSEELNNSEDIVETEDPVEETTVKRRGRPTKN